MARRAAGALLLALGAAGAARPLPPDVANGLEVVTFDFFAALMDTVRSLQGSARELLPRDEFARNLTAPQIDAFVEAWSGQYAGYVGVVNALQRNEGLAWGDKDLFRMMLNITLEHTCAKRGWPLRHGTKRALIESWKHLKPWANTAAMLRSLSAAKRPDGQRRFRLAALSNADYEFLRAGCVALEEEAGVRFDAYLGCDGLGTGGVCLFKPEPAFYNQTRQLLQNPGDDWKRRVMHVAGAEYDANGAKAFGLVTGWNSRRKEGERHFFDYTGTGRNVPDAVLGDIGDLPGVLGLEQTVLLM